MKLPPPEMISSLRAPRLEFSVPTCPPEVMTMIAFLPTTIAAWRIRCQAARTPNSRLRFWRSGSLRTERWILFIGAVLLAVMPGASQTEEPQPQTFFRKYIGLTPDEISSIRSGQAISKALKSRNAGEIFVWGSISINATPESYVKFATDFERLRKLPEFASIGKFSNPPVEGDLKGFEFDKEDIEALKKCKPTDCDIQMPSASMAEIQKSINWSAPNVNEQVHQRLHKGIVDRLSAYQREGNKVLGEYNDKDDPVLVSKRFEYMLGYLQALPKYLPDFNRYLLEYPTAKLSNVENTFYWANVKFGLKPTLRVIHVVVQRGNGLNEPSCSIAEKQLYSSHYFETALDMTACVPETTDPKPMGFYLIKVMGSEQSGLGGVKGSVVRKVAVDRSVSSLKKSLAAIKSILERKE